MSTKYTPRTNRTPWTDELSLVTVTKTADEDGYVTTAEVSKIICCTFSNGINRNEFYEGMKSGIKMSAQAEIWQADYSDEELCEHNGKRYKIVRTYETGRGTLDLSLSEVVR